MGDGLSDSAGHATRRQVLSVAPTPHGVRAGLLHMRGLLCADGVGADDRGTCETVLAEVLNNIVEHAYADGGAGDIAVSFARDDDGLDVVVTDGGAPMPGGRLPEPRKSALDVALDDLPEGGFGWAVIRDLTTRLDYQRCGGVNRLRFRVLFDT